MLTEEQIATINSWLQKAYDDGYQAALNQQEVNPVPIIHGCIPDISSFQPKPDYDELCGNTDFVILRARYCTKTDMTFEERAKEFNKRNHPFCVYDYVTLMSHGNAREQAQAIYNLCNKYDPKIYYIDTEQLGTGVKRGEEMEYIKTYVAKLRELGVKKIGQYTGDWLYSTYYYKLQDLFDTVWIASYGGSQGEDTGVVLVSDKLTDKVDLHQYTEKGVIPGISTRGDLSKLTGNKPLTWFTEK